MSKGQSNNSRNENLLLPTEIVDGLDLHKIVPKSLMVPSMVDHCTMCMI
jgi:hypothetical protein